MHRAQIKSLEGVRNAYGRLTNGGVYGHLVAAAAFGHDGLVAEEMGIYRGEVRTIMIALADMRVDLRRVRELLEDEDG